MITKFQFKLLPYTPYSLPPNWSSLDMAEHHQSTSPITTPQNSKYHLLRYIVHDSRPRTDEKDMFSVLDLETQILVKSIDSGRCETQRIILDLA